MDVASKLSLADRFDRPRNSPEYIALADAPGLGGPLVAVPFYLGSLIGMNLFRESDQAIEEQLVRYFTPRTSAEGAALLRGIDGWSLAADLLRFHHESKLPERSSQPSAPTARRIEAVERYLTNPSVPMPQLAAALGSTVKQLDRNTLLSQARNIALRRAREGHPSWPFGEAST